MGNRANAFGLQRGQDHPQETGRWVFMLTGVVELQVCNFSPLPSSRRWGGGGIELLTCVWLGKLELHETRTQRCTAPVQINELGNTPPIQKGIKPVTSTGLSRSLGLRRCKTVFLGYHLEYSEVKLLVEDQLTKQKSSSLCGRVTPWKADNEQKNLYEENRDIRITLSELLNEYL